MGGIKGVFVFWRRENMKRVDLGQGVTVRQQINKTFFLAIAVLRIRGEQTTMQSFSCCGVMKRVWGKF